MPNNGNFGFEMPPGLQVSGSASANGAYHATVTMNPLLDTDRAALQSSKIAELRHPEPPVELLERLDPAYGEYRVAHIIAADAIDYALDCITARGRTRIHRRRDETWEECLIRAGLLDGP